MITFKKGNLFESDCEVWVNTVNCVGVMGKGIAKEFKARFPFMFPWYEAYCKEGMVQTGRMLIWENEFWVTRPHWVVNFPTKEHWRDPSDMEWICAGLVDLCRNAKQYRWRGVAVPALGCGNGGLNWAEVRHAMERILKSVPKTRWEIYEPGE